MMQGYSRPRVSIGLPVYNGERYVAETLDSLLAQTFEDFELIICDNASTDGTAQICRSYAVKDARIRYVRNATNLGAAKNYRRTFELASSEYFRWANCDDLFAPESLARCVEVMDRQPSVVLAYPKTKLIDERGRVISEYEDGLHLQAPKASERFAQLYERLGLVNVLYGLVRADILRHTALIGDYIASDIALLAELTLYGTFWEIPAFLFYRRLHPGAYSSQKDERQRLKFYDPTTKRRVVLTQWRHVLENLRAVARAPLDNTEKRRLYAHIVRMGIWRRRELASELSAVLRQVILRS